MDPRKRNPGWGGVVEIIGHRIPAGLDNMAYDFSNLRVLIVDDNRFMRETIQAILESIGIGTVYHAINAEDGYKKTMDELPDVIISDWDMEPGDGITLVKWLRSRPDSPDPYIPIVMLTGFSERNRVMAARDSGVTEFLAKPVSTRAMHSRLISIIDQPRPFIRTEHYFGPDRRRRANGDYKGRERRKQWDEHLV